MKKSILPILYFCSLVTFSSAKNSNDAISVLKTTAKKLDEIKVLSYFYEREINYKKNNYFSKTSANCFIDYTKTNSILPFTFYFKTNDYQQFFNGTEYFALDEKDKTIEISEKPTLTSFSNYSFFYNSIPTLKSLLNEIAENDTVPKSLSDTLISNKKYHVVNFSLKNKTMNFLSYRPFSIELTIFYKLLINVESLLPYQIIEKNSNDKELYNTITTFSNISTNPKILEEKSWFYTTYQDAYQPKQKAMLQTMAAVGDQIKPWSLPVFAQKEIKTTASSAYKGKVVVLDFWIKNCSYCMESFPYLKAMQEKYGKENFQLITVNAYDESKELEFFYKREKPKYLMVYNGKELAKQLGIYSYPRVVIIGKNEKIAYVGGFDKEKLDEIIKQNL